MSEPGRLLCRDTVIRAIANSPTRGRTAVPRRALHCDSQDLTLHAVLSDGDKYCQVDSTNKQRKLVLISTG